MLKLPENKNTNVEIFSLGSEKGSTVIQTVKTQLLHQLYGAPPCAVQWNCLIVKLMWHSTAKTKKIPNRKQK